MPKILIVEDDADFAACLRESLEDDRDFEIVGVLGSQSEANAYFALDKLKEVDCILLDLRLPLNKGDSATHSTSGLMLLESLRMERGYYGNVIVLTNSSDMEDGTRALQAGCDSYLCKSVTMSHLDELLAELKVAILYRVLLVSEKMRHIFFREEISPKEAQLLDLLTEGKSWSEIAQALDYSTAKAAANTADRIFDKLIPCADKLNEKKKDKALAIWHRRLMRRGVRS
jgi:DNA-binding NarL/FixJ family response regulator